MPLPSHLFASESDGALWDTRAPDWNRGRALRVGYRAHASEIKSLRDVKAALRAGEFAWPGAYQMYFIADDGAALSFAAVKECWREVVAAHLDNVGNGWRVIGLEINYEDSELTCSHTGAPIPAAYGAD